MNTLDYAQVLKQVIREVVAAGELLVAEWQRPSGPRGSGDKADVDVEIENLLRTGLIEILNGFYPVSTDGYKTAKSF